MSLLLSLEKKKVNETIFAFDFFFAVFLLSVYVYSGDLRICNVFGGKDGYWRYCMHMSVQGKYKKTALESYLK